MINNTNKQEYVAGLKKANSVLSQALYKMTENNAYPVGDYSFLKENDVIDEFAKVVNIAKKCDNFSACFPKENTGDDTYKFLNNSNISNIFDGKSVITSDGQIFSYSANPATKYGISTEDINNIIGRFFVDINGHKNPNRLGYDAFLFYLVENRGIVPAGSDSSSDCNQSSAGWTCAGKVLRENAMNY